MSLPAPGGAAVAWAPPGGVPSAQRIVVRDVTATDRVCGPERGRRDLAAIARCLRPEPSVVALEMSGLTFVDASWARVVIGGLLGSPRPGHVFYLDRLVPGDVSDNIDAALFRVGGCVLARFDVGSYAVLGKSPSAAGLEVLRLVETRGETTARQICGVLGGLSITACNNRLKVLLGSRLVVRQKLQPDGGGRDYLYRAL